MDISENKQHSLYERIQLQAIKRFNKNQLEIIEGDNWSISECRLVDDKQTWTYYSDAGVLEFLFNTSGIDEYIEILNTIYLK